MAGRRAVAGTDHALESKKTYNGPAFKIDKKAAWIENRASKWDVLIKKHNDMIAKQPRKPIKIILPDGKEKDGTSFETTPMMIAQEISKKLADDCMVAKVHYLEEIGGVKIADADADSSDEEIEMMGDEEQEIKYQTWDMTRPLEGSCKIQLCKYDAPEGQDTFWHSSAHVLGQALEREYGTFITIGPALDNGFYYDCYLGDIKLTQENFAEIENMAKTIVKENQAFERCTMTKQDALDLFSDNPFKVALISSKVPDDALTSVYRNGKFIDLCRGPHVPTTAKFKAFKIMKNSSAYWLGKAENDSLQRLYGVSFPTEKLLKAHLTMLEEAAKRDHRNLGKTQELFFFHPTLSPGSCFWNAAGARIYNKLCEFMRQEYRIRGFDEIITPNIYSAGLFQTSGHYQNYKDDMYGFDVEGQEWFLKPMNCPGHCLVFDHRVRSYRELPMRLASFGVLHRNELSGTLSGLTRVRRFQQDDAHIFCRPDQLGQEIKGALDFLSYVYEVFGYEYTIALSTRPKKALGGKALWDVAEAELKKALTDHGHPWALNPGDGAFYGPKIDIRLTDALGRKHQCGTIQLDFQLPIRFNLQYRSETDGVKEGIAPEATDKKEEEKVEKDEKGNVIWREGKLKSGMERPIIIHRAILGSLERFTAILIEHTAGKLDFWVAPRQVCVVPISEKYNPYASWIAKTLHNQGFHAEADVGKDQLKKKIRNAQFGEMPYFYVACVGEKELQDMTVALSTKTGASGTFTIPDLLAKLEKENMPSSKTLKKIEPFEGRMPASSAAPETGAASPKSGQAGSPKGKDEPQA